MKTIELLGSVLLTLLLASAAHAGQGTWYRCGETRAAKNQIGPGVASCYGIDKDDYDSKSTTFHVENIALICFDPNTLSDGTDDAEVMILYCPPGAGSTPSDELCFDILDAVLTGATGAADTQNSCVRVARGNYWIEVVSAPLTTDQGVISVKGE